MPRLKEQTIRQHLTQKTVLSSVVLKLIPLCMLSVMCLLVPTVRNQMRSEIVIVVNIKTVQSAMQQHTVRQVSNSMSQFLRHV